MKVNVRASELHKLELPAGRPFGDCTCRCEALAILAVCLETNQGHRGWGFGQTISKGDFTRPAPYIVPMPSLAEIRADFERTAWPILQGRNPFALIVHRLDQCNEQKSTDSGKKDGQNLRGAGPARRAIVRAVIVCGVAPSSKTRTRPHRIVQTILGADRRDPLGAEHRKSDYCNKLRNKG
jgi:hypothetical protein